MSNKYSNEHFCLDRTKQKFKILGLNNSGEVVRLKLLVHGKYLLQKTLVLGERSQKNTYRRGIQIFAKIKLILSIMLHVILCRGSWVPDVLLHLMCLCLFSSHSNLCTMFTMQHFFSVIPHETAVQRYAAQGARLATHVFCHGPAVHEGVSTCRCLFRGW